MKKLFRTLTITASIMGIVALPTLVAPASYAQSAADQILGGAGQAAGGSAATGANSDIGGSFAKIVNIILYVLGAIAVIMIVIGGIRYVTSGGDSSGITAAKNTILYAVIGLIVAILAFAIVNFVAKSFGA